jgi:hypothetical protein
MKIDLEVYERAFARQLVKQAKASNKELHDISKRLIFHGVKAINRGMLKDIPDERFYFIRFIKIKMESLTPREFMNIFPIQKVYDGDKYECKDYFTTMDYINAIGIDEVIGANLDNLLWDYVNHDTRMFNTKTFLCMDDLRSFEGQPSMVTEFLESQGVYPLRKYEHNGKEFMLDTKTGKTHKVVKKSHLKLVK